MSAFVVAAIDNPVRCCCVDGRQMGTPLTRNRSPVRGVMEHGAAELRLLPRYSPSLNLIEKAFAKLKARLRKAAEPTLDDLGRHRQSGYGSGRASTTVVGSCLVLPSSLI
jgi:hypothetical protein